MSQPSQGATDTAALALDLVDALTRAKILTGGLIGINEGASRWLRSLETVGFVYEFHVDLRTAYEMSVRLARMVASGRRGEADAYLTVQALQPVLDSLNSAAIQMARNDERGSRLRRRDRRRGRALVQSLAQACNCNDKLLAQLATPAQAQAAVPLPPRMFAARLTRKAVLLLQPWARPRYAEEYQSELHDLAAAGASRLRMARYAVRLLARSVMLRIELHNAVHSEGSPRLPGWALQSDTGQSPSITPMSDDTGEVSADEPITDVGSSD